MDRTIKYKNIKQFGLSILEALVATVIVSIGFVAVFQMVNYSAQSINTSSERTKSNFLIDMIAEDLIAEKNTIYQDNRKLHDVEDFETPNTIYQVSECKKYISAVTSMYGTAANGPQNKKTKWAHLIDTNNIVKCKTNKDSKSVKIIKIVSSGTHDSIYFGRIQFKMNNGKKRKFLYFEIDYELGL